MGAADFAAAARLEDEKVSLQAALAILRWMNDSCCSDVIPAMDALLLSHRLKSERRLSHSSAGLSSWVSSKAAGGQRVSARFASLDKRVTSADLETHFALALLLPSS